MNHSSSYRSVTTPIDYIFYAMYRVSAALGGTEKEPEWGAAMSFAALASINVISLAAVLNRGAWVTIRDAAFEFSIGICAATLALAYLRFLRRERWRLIVEGCARIGGTRRTLYISLSVGYGIVSIALFTLALSLLWPSNA